MSATEDAVTLVFNAIPQVNKDILTRTTAENFPFVNVEVGGEGVLITGNVDRRSVGITVAVYVLDSDPFSLFQQCDAIEAALDSVPGLTFRGYSRVNSSFDFEVNLLYREMTYSYTKLMC
jgi:hypothetical protein